MKPHRATIIGRTLLVGGSPAGAKAPRAAPLALGAIPSILTGAPSSLVPPLENAPLPHLPMAMGATVGESGRRPRRAAGTN